MWAALSHGWTLGCLSRESQLGAERASSVGATHFSLLWLWIWWDWLLALPPWLLSGILSQKLPFLRLQLSVRVSVMATEMKLGQRRPACCYCCHLLALFEQFCQNQSVWHRNSRKWFIRASGVRKIILEQIQYLVTAHFWMTGGPSCMVSEGRGKRVLLRAIC